MGRIKWEYSVYKKRTKGFAREDTQLLAWLNRLGADGWELVHLYSVGSLNSSAITWIGVFKRQRAGGRS